MTKVLFVDDRIGDVFRQWQLSGCASNHSLLHLEPFVSIERTRQVVGALEPDVIIVGHGLGKPDITGSDVIQVLRKSGYKGLVVTNSGGETDQFKRDGVEIDGSANRTPHDLKMVIDKLTKEKNP